MADGKRNILADAGRDAAKGFLTKLITAAVLFVIVAAVAAFGFRPQVEAGVRAACGVALLTPGCEAVGLGSEKDRLLAMVPGRWCAPGVATPYDYAVAGDVISVTGADGWKQQSTVRDVRDGVLTVFVPAPEADRGLWEVRPEKDALVVAFPQKDYRHTLEHCP